jgi:hypothetical protein
VGEVSSGAAFLTGREGHGLLSGLSGRAPFFQAASQPPLVICERNCHSPNPIRRSVASNVLNQASSFLPSRHCRRSRRLIQSACQVRSEAIYRRNREHRSHGRPGGLLEQGVCIPTKRAMVSMPGWRQEPWCREARYEERITEAGSITAPRRSS